MATLQFTDTFNRADTSTGSAGNTTSVGNNWKDVIGGIYSISGNKLKCGVGFTNNGVCAKQDNALQNPLIAAIVSSPGIGRGVRLALIGNDTNADYYCTEITSSGVFNIAKVVGGTRTQLGGNGSYAVDSNDYLLALGRNGTTLTAKVYHITDVATPIATLTRTDSDAALTGTLRAGMNAQVSSGSPITTVDYLKYYDFNDNVWPTLDTPSPTAGVATLTSVSTTNIALSATAPSNGTGTLSNQWHRSSTSGFTPGAGTAISGATSTTLNETPAAGTFWFYKFRTTDQLNVTADSNQVGAQLQDSTVTSIVLGFVGDSKWAQAPSDSSSGLTVPQAIALWLGRTLNLDRAITIVNRAIGGTTSGDWASTVSSGYLKDALDAFVAAGVTHVMLELGTNDSSTLHAVSAATYSTNMTTIVNAILARGMKVIVHYPMYIKPDALNAFGQGSVDLLLQYQPKIDLLVNGTTVLQGDKLAFREFAKHVDSESWYIGTTITGASPDGNDWVHPNARGVYALAELQAQRLMSILNPSAVIVLDD